MNILVTNQQLDGFGGSETFTYTFIQELIKLGHNVDVFTLFKGFISSKLKNVVDVPKPEYDVIFSSHNTCLSKLLHIKAYKIHTCHGVGTNTAEAPIPGADKYVAISEEVQDGLKLQGYDSILIRNGIDCERFKPQTQISELRDVYSLCQGHVANNLLEQTCKKMGLNLNRTKAWNVEDLINNAELVVTLGRGAYEAMACGRNVLVFDSRSYMKSIPKGDGMITKENIDVLIKHNCSGRALNIEFNIDQLISEIEKYSPENGGFNRNYALKHFNSKSQVQKYLSLVEA